jgi:hypothetical protein
MDLKYEMKIAKRLALLKASKREILEAVIDVNKAQALPMDLDLTIDSSIKLMEFINLELIKEVMLLDGSWMKIAY